MDSGGGGPHLDRQGGGPSVACEPGFTALRAVCARQELPLVRLRKCDLTAARSHAGPSVCRYPLTLKPLAP